jgi:hypothetical protein
MFRFRFRVGGGIAREGNDLVYGHSCYWDKQCALYIAGVHFGVEPVEPLPAKRAALAAISSLRLLISAYSRSRIARTVSCEVRRRLAIRVTGSPRAKALIMA